MALLHHARSEPLPPASDSRASHPPLAQISELESGQDDTDEMDLLQSSLSDLKEKLAAAVAENTSLNDELEGAMTKVVAISLCTLPEPLRVVLFVFAPYARFDSLHPDSDRPKPQR